MTRGPAATPDPFDLSAVNSSDELFDALSTRRLDEHAETNDPAAALLTALVADVDAGAPPLPAPARVTCGRQSSRRRGTRAVVTFGVAALVLTSAGAAAAGGGEGIGAGAMGAHAPAGHKDTERSNENVQRQDPLTGALLTGRRSPARRAGDKRRYLPGEPPEDLSPRVDEDGFTPAPEGQQGGHRSRRSAKPSRHSPADLRHSPACPDPRSSSDLRTPVPWSEYAPLTP